MEGNDQATKDNAADQNLDPSCINTSADNMHVTTLYIEAFQLHFSNV